MFNIFVLAFLAVVVGFGLAIWISRAPEGEESPRVPAEDDAALDPEGPPLTFEDLFKLGEKLCSENQLQVKEKTRQSDTEYYWVAETKNDFFEGVYLLAFIATTPRSPLVSMSKVLEFKDFLKSVQSTKGILLTTGYFTRDVHQPLEGPKVSLYNRLKVLNELQEL